MPWVVAAAGIWIFTGEVSAQGRRGGLVGKTAPEFHVQGIFQEAYSLETFKGHILVMQFGTSW